MNEIPKPFNITQIVLDPRTVDKLLEINIRNRARSAPRETLFAESIQADGWSFKNPQGMMFIVNESMTWLMDGQTRLEAIRRAGEFGHIAILAKVADEDAEEVFKTIDSGRGRTSGMTLSALGVENANVRAAIARTLLVEIDKNGNAAKVSTSEINEYVYAHQETLSALPISKTHVGLKRPFPCAILAGVFNAIRIGFMTKTEAREFLVEALDDSGDATSGSRALSRYVQSMFADGGSRARGHSEQFAIATKCAKAQKERRPIFKLIFKPGDIEFSRSGDRTAWDI